ncbi:acyl-CoA synthetase domain protein [Mycobacterium xenopi 3993]|nr:acyl-CoA synthetase domain protein [Mycobacterium xenopi 3993]
MLNSSFSGPQIKEVTEREDAKLLIYDDEYTNDVSKVDPRSASCGHWAATRTPMNPRAAPTKRWPS